MKILFVISVSLLSSLVFSQSLLNVKCYPDAANSYNNQFSLNGNIIDYGVLSLDPNFHIAIIDTSCVVWHTSTGSVGSDYGSINPGVPMPNYFFAYDQDNASSLKYLDSLINYWIPAGHAFVIYTPLGYNGPNTASICPELAQTFETKWGNISTQTQSIVVLFGVQGYPNSFTMDTLTTGTHIDFSVNICPHYEQTLKIEELNETDEKINIFPNPGSGAIYFEINNTVYTEARVYGQDGTLIQSFKISEQPANYTISDLMSGIYFLQLLKGSDVQIVKKIVLTE